MLTCKSPRKVMRAAWFLAREALPKYSSKFSRHDFTLPQLFACLVLREHQHKSYRHIEVLLRDSPHWCREIGMKKTPDHNTLCRAFHALNLGRRQRKLLDRLTQWFAIAKQLGSIVAIDSSLYDTHHRSRHYEQRCRHYASREKSTVNARRRAAARQTPKLGVGVCTRSHVILSTCVKTGMGSDCRDFEPLLTDACRRHPRLRTVVADAGYDSESNHCIARLKMKVRSFIKTGAGRPSKKPPSGYYRRLMSRRLKGSQRGKKYGQRAQVETVNSMLKRNLGDSLRARSTKARRNEQLLRVIAHNLALLCDEIEGRD
jgi:IS5 family transposase